MESSSGEPCDLLEWDSAFFGRRIARLRGGRLDAERLAAVERWAAERRIDCLYLLADPADSAGVALAESAGFRLVDLRLTLERPAGGAPARQAAGIVPPGSIAVRPARPEDLAALEALAAASHRDSRFFHDPGFDPRRAGELYAVWIAQSWRGEADAVFVAELADDVSGKVAGYVTCLARQAGEGQIGLFAVAPAAQGRGTGGLLLAEALAWLAARGAATVRVVTQGRNVRAQRLYQRFGFLTRSVELWLHRWSTPDRGGVG